MRHSLNKLQPSQKHLENRENKLNVTLKYVLISDNF